MELNAKIVRKFLPESKFVLASRSGVTCALLDEVRAIFATSCNLPGRPTTVRTEMITLRF
eukprot:4221947-Amphidinium_carterae.2